MKRLALALVAFLSCALNASAVVTIDPTAAPLNPTILVQFVGEVDADDDCLWPLGTSITPFSATSLCNVALNKFVIPKGAIVTGFAVQILAAGGSGSGCIVSLLNNTTPVGVPMTLPTDVGAGVLRFEEQPNVVFGLENMRIQVLDGEGALVCRATLSAPEMLVSVFGFWTE